MLLGNLLLRSFTILEKIQKNNPVYCNAAGYKFSGRYRALKWYGENMRVTNYEPANQFVKRDYRKGWGSGSL